ncbi:MAG: hypothetical protein JRD94_11820 [Deltaproteobacteria bacterium]|nr:hypothetical protein [Deltaproteobacteria bacterium]
MLQQAPRSPPLIEGTDWEPVVTAAIERDQQTAFDQVLPEHAALVASDRRNTRPIAQQTALVSDSKWRVKARIDGRPVDFTSYRQRSGWLHELDRLVTTLRRLTEDDVPHLGTATLQSITWSTVSGFKGLENDGSARWSGRRGLGSLSPSATIRNSSVPICKPKEIQ